MLTHIHIRDLATIEALDLVLQHGCTMISGETGAGKSIFIEAIELALGGRGSQNKVRMGKDKAEITLTFDINSFPQVTALLKELDLDDASNECLIRRIIQSDGRSRCYVNGSPVPLQFVKELGELLFHLHGQHEQQVLIKADTQREMLDRYAEHLPLVASTKQLADQAKTLAKQIDMLRTSSELRAKKLAELRIELDELEAAKLQSGEWEILEAEHKRLSHAEELIHHLQQAIFLITDDQQALAILNDIRKTLESVRQVEIKADGWLALTESTSIQLQELEAELNAYLENTQLDPEKLQLTENRISELFDLGRKYKVSPPELIAYQKNILDEFNALNISDDELIQLTEQHQLLISAYQKSAEKLFKSREKAARKLEKIITEIIRSLSLPHADFQILVDKDQVNFLIKTNPDQALQPLAKVISGGELSRLSLAAHLALAKNTHIPTLIFDEVDTGLSGATAEKIGKLLRQLGESYQVFCITHQPQVAACGHHHLLVEKYVADHTTYTRLRLLNQDEKTHEIARMLGGEKITPKTLAHAKEVLQHL